MDWMKLIYCMTQMLYSVKSVYFLITPFTISCTCTTFWEMWLKWNALLFSSFHSTEGFIKELFRKWPLYVPDPVLYWLALNSILSHLVPKYHYIFKYGSLWKSVAKILTILWKDASSLQIHPDPWHHLLTNQYVVIHVEFAELWWWMTTPVSFMQWPMAESVW